MLLKSFLQHHGRSVADFARISVTKALGSLGLICLYVVYGYYNNLPGDFTLGMYLAVIPIMGLLALWRFHDTLEQIDTALYVRRIFGLIVILAAANLISVDDAAFQVRILFIYPFIYFIYVNEFSLVDRFKFPLFIALGNIGVFFIPTESSHQIALSFLMIFASVIGFDTVKLRESNAQLTKELDESTKKKIYDLSHYDALTGLPNQVGLTELTSSSVMLQDWEHRSVAVIAVGIDGFKAVNETFGHHVGDLVLAEVANRLRLIVSNDEILMRFNGDQFHLLVLDGATTEKLRRKTGAITDALSRPYNLDGQQIILSASQGIAEKTDANEALNKLQHAAEAAMHEAKHGDGASVVFFEPQIIKSVQDRFLIESELRLAAETFQQFELHFQPVVNLQTGEISGAEALLRWHNPKFGPISPDVFIPIAEKTGLIISIGYWVLADAISTIAKLQEEGIELVSMGINLSAGQLHDPALLERIIFLLETYPSVSSEQVDLELTESAVMANPEEAIEKLQRLRDCGMTLSIDDFGVAYSSLNYLKRLPANCLKIDRSFVTDLCRDRGDQAIVSSTIVLAHKLGLEVLAEGVENEEQLEALKSLGCDEIQGYHVGRPMSYQQFLGFVKASKEA